MRYTLKGTGRHKGRHRGEGTREGKGQGEGTREGEGGGAGGGQRHFWHFFACHPKFLASAKLFAVPKVPNF